MNDDWDGSDWEELFGGPQDDEIERSNQFQHETDDDDLSFSSFSTDTSDAAGEQYLWPRYFIDFASATAFATKHAKGENQCFVIARDREGWHVEKDLSNFEDLSCHAERENAALKSFNATQLRHALRISDHERASFLLLQPIAVNEPDQQGVTALMIAAYRGMPEICEKLLELGAIADHIFGNSAFHQPNQLGTLERAHASRDTRTIALIDRAYTHERWKSLKSISKPVPDDLIHFLGNQLLEAARLGMTLEVVEMILFGVDVNYTGDDDFRSPLWLAFESNHRETSLVLLAMGANLNWTNSQEYIEAQGIELQNELTKFRDLFAASKLSKLADFY